MNNNTNDILVQDWYQAAYLSVNGFEFGFRPRPGCPQRVDLVFQDSEDLQRAIRDFNGNRGVAVLSFREAWKGIAEGVHARREA